MDSCLDADRNFKNKGHTFPDVLRTESPFVYPMSGFYLNERLVKQQGLFLCPGAVCQPFEDNLVALQYDDSANQVEDAASRLIKIDISTAPDTRKDVLRELLRMNMSTSTLYPGIQGFARSLEHYLVVPDILEYGLEYDADFPLTPRR